MGAQPIFVDVSPISLSLCPKAVEQYLEEHAELTPNGCFHKKTKQRIKAVVPMHTFSTLLSLMSYLSYAKNGIYL